MDAMEKHLLQKLDTIRDDQIRGLERVDEIRNLLRQSPASPAPQPAVSQSMSAPSSAQSNLDWLLSMNSLTWLLRTFFKHLPTIGALVYMKATGQDEKILLYLNGLFGI